MAETKPGGVYKVGDSLVNAEGKPVKAPKQEEPPQDGMPYADLLAKGGYADEDAVRDANDEDLLAVSGIGPAKLKEIRDYLG